MFSGCRTGTRKVSSGIMAACALRSGLASGSPMRARQFAVHGRTARSDPAPCLLPRELHAKRTSDAANLREIPDIPMRMTQQSSIEDSAPKEPVTAFAQSLALAEGVRVDMLPAIDGALERKRLQGSRALVHERFQEDMRAQQAGQQ